MLSFHWTTLAPLPQSCCGNPKSPVLGASFSAPSSGYDLEFRWPVVQREAEVEGEREERERVWALASESRSTFLQSCFLQRTCAAQALALTPRLLVHTNGKTRQSFTNFSFMSAPLCMQWKHGFCEENNLVVPQGWGVAQWKRIARMYKVLGSISAPQIRPNVKPGITPECSNSSTRYNACTHSIELWQEPRGETIRLYKAWINRKSLWGQQRKGKHKVVCTCVGYYGLSMSMLSLTNGWHFGIYCNLGEL